MWKQKISISLGNHYEVDTSEVVKLVKEIGFDAISPEYEGDEVLLPIVQTAEACGLGLASLHAPFGRAAAMWQRDEEAAAPAREELLRSVAACRRHRIPILVVHTWIGFDYTFDGRDLYFGNFDTVVAAAAEAGVRIAFENTEGEEYLFALMEHYKGNEAVGFCWDAGHEMCYNHSRDLLALFGDRLLLTHLNDNLGISRFDGKTYWTDDLHLLPYDGIADWEEIITRLRGSRPLPYLNFELNLLSKPGRHENDEYGRMGYTAYFTAAYRRACRLAYRYSKD